MLSRSCWCAQAGHQMSLCWAHGLLFVGAMCSHVDCLSPPILLLNHCFSGSSCVSLVTLVCRLPVFCLPACFSPSGWFLFFFVLFIIKNNFFPCIWVLDLISRDRMDQPRWGLSRGGVWTTHHPPLSPAPYTNASSSLRPWAPAVSRAMTWGGLPWSSVVQLRV